MSTYFPSYDELHTNADAIAKAIANSDIVPDIVVGLSRGGLFLAVCLSEWLSIPMVAVNYSSAAGRGDGRTHNYLPSLNAETILVVDDISDSGNTLREVREHYEQEGIKVLTATYHYKESSKEVPDFYCWKLPVNAPFVFYPHEWHKAARDPHPDLPHDTKSSSQVV